MPQVKVRNHNADVVGLVDELSELDLAIAILVHFLNDLPQVIF